MPTQPELRQQAAHNSALSISALQQLTRMVVMMSVLLASVSETFISRLVEFMARVLLEYQIPI